MINKNYFCVGVITAPHGIRGDVKVRTFLEEPAGLLGLGNFTDQDGKPGVVITKVRPAKGGTVVASVKGITDRNQADDLRGLKLYVDKQNFPKAKKGEYYCSDLIGLSVENSAGKAIGRVQAIFDFGAGDVIEISQEGEKESLMLPFHKDFFPTVEPRMRLIVSLPEDDGHERY